MKLRITSTVMDEITPAIEDSLGRSSGSPQETDATYLKINAAWDAAKSTKRGVVIELDADDVAELKSRAEYQLEVCAENIGGIYSLNDEMRYWLGRQRAYRALLKQIAAGGL